MADDRSRGFDLAAMAADIVTFGRDELNCTCLLLGRASAGCRSVQQTRGTTSTFYRAVTSSTWTPWLWGLIM
eukprot:2345021-Prymnesium_polylepis.1